MKLSNGLLSLVFDERTGSLSQITDLRTRRRFLNDASGNRLVKLIVPTPAHTSRPLYSHAAGRPLMATGPGQLMIDFPELQDADGRTGIFISVRVRLPEGSPEAFLSLEIRNQGKYRVHEAWFPWIGGRRGRPGHMQDRVTISKRPLLDIFVQMAKGPRETHGFGHHNQRWGHDGISMLPMMDLSDAAGGLSYVKYEQRPSPHILVFENTGYGRDEITLSWAWATGCFVEPGTSWRSAEVGLGVHQGDWHQTADRLRDWVRTWWKPCDTPPAIREKLGLFHIQTHGFSGERYHEFSALPGIAADAARFGLRDLMLWDYTASVYLRPDRGGFWEMSAARRQELKRALTAVREQDVSVSAFVNWRLLSRRNSTWDALKPLAQESLFGEGMYGFPSPTMDGGCYSDAAYEMGSYSVCCGADAYRPFANAVLKRTLDLGFNVLAVDQAAEWNYCLSRTHGHATPWEAWARTYAWYGEAARRTRARHPGTYTLGELPDLYNTQYIDLWWNWSWREGTWVRADIFRYVLPAMIPCWCIDENQRDVIAESFAVGSFMAIATRDMTGLLSDEPALAQQVARLAALRRETAAVVAHGTFRDTLGLQVRGGGGYVFTGPGGLGITLANGRPVRARLQVVLTPSALGLTPSPRGFRLHGEGCAPVAITPRRRGESLVFDAVLPARAAAVITAREEYT